MSDSLAALHRKIDAAGDLQSVVRTMKALSASSIGQYENAVRALADYSRTVELGLGACFRANLPEPRIPARPPRGDATVIGAVVFGSDQGLVGQFNEAVAGHAIRSLSRMPGRLRLWAVGERVHASLLDAGLPAAELFAVPASIKAITPLVARILMDSELPAGQEEADELHLFYNHPTADAVYAPTGKRLLPLDAAWRGSLAGHAWPSVNLPEVLGRGTDTLRALIREYLFVSLFRACAESLASENAARLAAMQRAEKNIDDLLADLSGSFRRLRQSGIDEELFDVIAGFEALGGALPEAR